MIDETPIKTTVEELTKLVNINNFVGQAIETEDKILIPVSKAAVGFGIGERESDSSLTGSGAGASVEPVTMVVVTKGVAGIEGIRTLNLTKGTEMNKALSDVGVIVADLIKEFIPSAAPGGNPYMDAEDIVYQEAVYKEAEDSVNVNIDEVPKTAEDLKSDAEEIVETAEDIKKDAEEIKVDIEDKLDGD